MAPDRFAAARWFIRREARVLEQRLFAALFEGGPAAGVIDALRAYRNHDGGFGHGLEPDKLCPASLAIDVEMALLTMAAIDHPDRELIWGACEFLDRISVDGAVPLASPAIEQYPRAVHWSDSTYRPDLCPTAGIVGLLHRFGVEHPWRERATRWCWERLEAGLPEDAHAFGEVLAFLEHAGDPERMASVAARFPEHLSRLSYFRKDAQDPKYGLTPLHYAPTPESPWRALFADDVIEAHLDRLEADQQNDGGWAITWEPPSRAATLAYRGIETVRALRVLDAYGRIRLETSGR
ncbi:MAG TPA: hypothetical protein VIN61_00465 [Gammaproteobacteria bacterium]